MKYNERELEKLIELLKRCIKYEYEEYNIYGLNSLSMKNIRNVYELYYLMLNNLENLRYINPQGIYDKEKIYDPIYEPISIFIKDNTYFIFKVENPGYYGIMTIDFINFYECNENIKSDDIISAPKFIKWLGFNSPSLASSILNLMVSKVLTELLFLDDDGGILRNVNVYKSPKSDSVYIILTSGEYENYLFTLTL